jgi:hypothetical protein
MSPSKRLFGKIVFLQQRRFVLCARATFGSPENKGGALSGKNFSTRQPSGQFISIHNA